MANYKVGDIIRLTRKSVGMSQEEIAFLAELTPETISRIESGKHKITQNTYRKIMSILKRFSNQNYAICTGKDVGIIDEKKLLEEAEIKFEYKEAEKHLNNLKEQIGDNIIDLQYVLRAETLLDYYNHKIVAETMVKNLEEALKLTLVDWDIHSNFYMSENEVYPFTEQEILILMNLSGAYNECGNPEMSEKISNMILKCLNAEYLKSDDLAILTGKGTSFIFQQCFAPKGLCKYNYFLILEQILKDNVMKTNFKTGDYIEVWINGYSCII